VSVAPRGFGSWVAGIPRSAPGRFQLRSRMGVGAPRIRKGARGPAERRRSRLLVLSFGGVVVGACGDHSVPVLELVPSTSLDTAAQSDGAASFRLRYEAEAVPPNVLTLSAIVDQTCFGTNLTCPTNGVEEGANCCSGGGAITEILGRVPCSGPPGSAGDYVDCSDSGAGVEFHDVTVPADGTYDVTWWYHCGAYTGSDAANVDGDTACGGLHYAVGAGCRPQLIDVNGVPVSGTGTVDAQSALIYQFPCYSGAWSVLHGATTALPLKSGANTIYFHAPHATNLDASDIDAIDVLPHGQGVQPWVTPVVSGY
jgi:hypothetical protein